MSQLVLRVTNYGGSCIAALLYAWAVRNEHTTVTYSIHDYRPEWLLLCCIALLQASWRSSEECRKLVTLLQGMVRVSWLDPCNFLYIVLGSLCHGIILLPLSPAHVCIYKAQCMCVHVFVQMDIFSCVQDYRISAIKQCSYYLRVATIQRQHLL